MWRSGDDEAGSLEREGERERERMWVLISRGRNTESRGWPRISSWDGGLTLLHSCLTCMYYKSHGETLLSFLSEAKLFCLYYIRPDGGKWSWRGLKIKIFPSDLQPRPACLHCNNRVGGVGWICRKWKLPEYTSSTLPRPRAGPPIQQRHDGNQRPGDTLLSLCAPGNL